MNINKIYYVKKKQNKTIIKEIQFLFLFVCLFTLMFTINKMQK